MGERTRDTEAVHSAAHAGFRAPSPANGPQSGVWCTQQLPQAVRVRASAVHEATHAVLGSMLGMTPVFLRVNPSPFAPEGGGCSLALDGTNAQYVAIALLGAAPAQADQLEAAGYDHPQLRRCVEILAGSGDADVVEGHERDGFVVDRAQALVDARILLATAPATAAVTALADRLLAAGTLTAEAIAICLAGFDLTPATWPWKPIARLPLLTPVSCLSTTT